MYKGEVRMAKLLILVKRDGTLDVDAQGFTGTACKDATRALERKFAGARMDVTEKPEMAMLDTVQHESMEMML
jgi:heat shock protein HslJ